MENEMIERVARAMCAGIGFDWPYADEISEREFLMMARAAIAAMREPTEFMVDQGYDASPATPDFYWNVMCDAALGKKYGPSPFPTSE